jgi:hypothetical protein
VPTGDDWKVFRVIGDSLEECQAAIDRLIASGEARPTDHFVSRLIVDPVTRPSHQDHQPFNSLPRNTVIGSNRTK